MHLDRDTSVVCVDRSNMICSVNLVWIHSIFFFTLLNLLQTSLADQLNLKVCSTLFIEWIYLKLFRISLSSNKVNCNFLSKPFQKVSVKECLRLKRTSADCPVHHPAQSSRVTWSRLPWTMSTCFSSISEDGDATTSLGNLYKESCYFCRSSKGNVWGWAFLYMQNFKFFFFQLLEFYSLEQNL